MGVLTERTRKKLDTPRWSRLRDLVILVGETILGVSPDAQGDLAGTYVKFTISSHPSSPAYAVVWLKLALPKLLIVGLALPEDYEATGLGPPPERVFYRGITRFLVVEEGQAAPEELSTWAKLAYQEAFSDEP
jgi:hypothetical protein